MTWKASPRYHTWNLRRRSAPYLTTRAAYPHSHGRYCSDPNISKLSATLCSRNNSRAGIACDCNHPTSVRLHSAGSTLVGRRSYRKIDCSSSSSYGGGTTLLKSNQVIPRVGLSSTVPGSCLSTILPLATAMHRRKSQHGPQSRFRECRKRSKDDMRQSGGVVSCEHVWQ